MGGPGHRAQGTRRGRLAAGSLEGEMDRKGQIWEDKVFAWANSNLQCHPSGYKWEVYQSALAA